MPDHRKHRGPHPEDTQLFAVGDSRETRLANAVSDLSWLMGRGYASVSSSKLVGDRYNLAARQLLAVSRCACSDADRELRLEQRVSTDDVAYEPVWIDGYNVLTSIEAALSHGVILKARDGCFRDMASMHGSYRKVQETVPAIQMLGKAIAGWEAGPCTWLLDRPVSNSGRLKGILIEQAQQHGWDWQVELVADPDPILSASEHIVVSADSQIINQASRHLNLVRIVLEQHVPDAWVIDLSGSESA